MKKSIIFTAIAAIAINFAAFAQTPEEIQASAARVAQLLELQQPKAAKVASVDALAADCDEAAKASVKISEELTKLCQTPDLTTALELSLEIKNEATALADAAKKMETVSNEVKDLKNPLQIAGATKSLNYSRKALQLVGEESTYHGKVIAAMIASLKSE